jgi:hypothetical protein
MGGSNIVCPDTARLIESALGFSPCLDRHQTTYLDDGVRVCGHRNGILHFDVPRRHNRLARELLLIRVARQTLAIHVDRCVLRDERVEGVVERLLRRSRVDLLQVLLHPASEREDDGARAERDVRHCAVSVSGVYS